MLFAEHTEIIQHVLADVPNVLERFEGMQNTATTREAIASAITGLFRMRYMTRELPTDYVVIHVFQPPHDAKAIRIGIRRNFALYPITLEQAREMFGPDFREENLHRLCCDTPGAVGHYGCGWCNVHDEPRFECGCFAS